MTYKINGCKITIPEDVLRNYKDTMKLDLDEDCVAVYVESVKQQNPAISSNSEISSAVINELYYEISDCTKSLARWLSSRLSSR